MLIIRLVFLGALIFCPVWAHALIKDFDLPDLEFDDFGQVSNELLKLTSLAGEEAGAGDIDLLSFPAELIGQLPQDEMSEDTLFSYDPLNISEGEEVMPEPESQSAEGAGPGAGSGSGSGSAVNKQVDLFCKSCNKRFKSSKRFSNHKILHLEKQIFTFSKYNKVEQLAALIKSIKSDANFKPSSLNMSLAFAKKYKLDEIIKLLVENGAAEENIFICPHEGCDSILTSEGFYQRHILLDHSSAEENRKRAEHLWKSRKDLGIMIERTRKKFVNNLVCTLCFVTTGTNSTVHINQGTHQGNVKQKMAYLRDNRKTSVNALAENNLLPKDQLTKFKCAECNEKYYACACFYECVEKDLEWFDSHFKRIHNQNEFSTLSDDGFYICNGCYNKKVNYDYLMSKLEKMKKSKQDFIREFAIEQLSLLSLPKETATTDSKKRSRDQFEGQMATIDFEGLKNEERDSKKAKVDMGVAPMQVDSGAAIAGSEAGAGFGSGSGVSIDIETYIKQSFQKLTVDQLDKMLSSGLNLDNYLINLCYEHNSAMKLSLLLDKFIESNVASDQKLEYLDQLAKVSQAEFVKVIQEKIAKLKSGVVTMQR